MEDSAVEASETEQMGTAERLAKLQDSVDHLTELVEAIAAVFESFAQMMGGGGMPGAPGGAPVDASVKLLS
jgi:hypothetical protein